MSDERIKPNPTGFPEISEDHLTMIQDEVRTRNLNNLIAELELDEPDLARRIKNDAEMLVLPNQTSWPQEPRYQEERESNVTMAIFGAYVVHRALKETADQLGIILPPVSSSTIEANEEDKWRGKVGPTISDKDGITTVVSPGVNEYIPADPENYRSENPHIMEWLSKQTLLIRRGGMEYYQLKRRQFVASQLNKMFEGES